MRREHAMLRREHAMLARLAALAVRAEALPAVLAGGVAIGQLDAHIVQVASEPLLPLLERQVVDGRGRR